MVENGMSKNQGQRKRRQESCLNNVKIHKACAHRRDNVTRHPNTRHQRGSLENVSSNPWGDTSYHNDDEPSSLRRSRSLAITRDDIFTSLNIDQNYKRRSQLIPRAKLIDRTKDQSHVRSQSIEVLRWKDRQIQEENHYESLTHLDANRTNEDSVGLSLPNYYPDFRYDTDNTDNISLTDNISTESCDNKRYSSCGNISNVWSLEEKEEKIPYDDNIILSTNRPLYDSIREQPIKPRTIRGPTLYNPTDLGNCKELIKTQKESVETPVQENGESHKTNSQTYSSYSNIETNPLYEQVEEYREDNTNKTLIEVAGESNKDDEQYKSIVSVDNVIDCDKKSKETRHSHNYLREFIETQKGSKGPLQNFLTKKFANLSRKNSKELNTNLIDNQFYSLPDITASKNLRKCEKIDRKLRKCEKSNRSTRKNIDPNNQNRFIVNIGNHFDLTTNDRNQPVDFEVKIAKIPKKNKNVSKKCDEQFLEAVRNLKETLNNNLDENQNITIKPEIVAIQTKHNNIEERKETTMETDKKTTEYQEKLDTMRNYWSKIKEEEFCQQCQNDETEKIKVNGALSCKIIDVQTKVEDVKKKFEPKTDEEQEQIKQPNKVQLVKQIFEPKPLPEKQEKLAPFIKETCNYFEKCYNQNDFESLSPTAVDIVDKDNLKEEIEEKPIDIIRKPNDNHRTHKPIVKSQTINTPEFDHVRYRVMKSDLFQKKIFANCEKESQFDGLIQYLQDYSFQELLIDNNIVIIEPIRTKVTHESTNNVTKTTRNITPYLHQKRDDKEEDSKPLRRHFFYHPIRVNKEVNDDELPNPDTVKQVRQFFEGGLKRSRSSQELTKIDEETNETNHINDPDKDHCSAADTNSEYDSQENLYDSLTAEQPCCEKQYVSEDILEKIRECGTTVTYYGGRVVKKQYGQPSLTKVIMEEIRNSERRTFECKCKRNCDKEKVDYNNRDVYQGVKFRLVKSNSCNSRLELAGANDIDDMKKHYSKKEMMTRNEDNRIIHEMKGENELQEIIEKNNTDNRCKDKNTINENIRQAKMKEDENMNEWNNIGKTFNRIPLNEKSKINYDYHNYDKVETKSKAIDDMEFEPYEIA